MLVFSRWERLSSRDDFLVPHVPADRASPRAGYDAFK